MKTRISVAAALIGGLVLSLSGAQAATPALDGKKTKSLTITANGGQQAHDADVDDLDLLADCGPEQCARVSFLYKPAGGVKGDLALSATWSSPLADFDIYLYENKSGTEVATCGAALGTSERAYVPRSELKSGKTYTFLVRFYRSLDDQVTGKVEMGSPNTVPTTVPADANSVIDINCGL